MNDSLKSILNLNGKKVLVVIKSDLASGFFADRQTMYFKRKFSWDFQAKNNMNIVLAYPNTEFELQVQILSCNSISSCFD